MKNINTEKSIIITAELNMNDTIEIPIEHQRIVLDRMAKAKSNPKRLLDWDEVSKTL